MLEARSESPTSPTTAARVMNELRDMKEVRFRAEPGSATTLRCARSRSSSRTTSRTSATSPPVMRPAWSSSRTRGLRGAWSQPSDVGSCWKLHGTNENPGHKFTAPQPTTSVGVPAPASW